MKRSQIIKYKNKGRRDEGRREEKKRRRRDEVWDVGCGNELPYLT